ncbi:MAG: hypothetical protein D3910_28660, partial [Candidatus Electrothrix sp. ATG2]|nr:hypothetical protein [Candidatus Electrothrix sp. ATG2]
ECLLRLGMGGQVSGMSGQGGAEHCGTGYNRDYFFRHNSSSYHGIFSFDCEIGCVYLKLKP